ncbi:MAG: hypothetical protein KBG22_00960 [Smithella sp.]|nr:hypothetical protein [Smithella sp.]MDM7988159.1 hypothetical protein [Smithella sp.]HOU51607.1 hypothetical protein [Smithella sp.]HQG66202.1 hypothetical protein [Smithella sp.]HQH17240.1 hypothetical protein [Smithella sp.]
MNVKGIIYMTGKNAIVEVFGLEPWNSFMVKLAAKDKFFSNPIMSITPVPLDKFILFLDELVKEFFNNDMMQYVTFGKVAAQFVLSDEGMYKAYRLTKDKKTIVEMIVPKLWATYFDEGMVTAKLENNVAYFKVTGLKFKHRYFEFLVMGFLQKALKIYGMKNVPKLLRSMVAGDEDVCYQFELKDA